jgi:hypothetical protein
MKNEFKRIQKLAGINEIKVIRPGKKLNTKDLDVLKHSILDVYTDWLDLSDHADDGRVWDTEYDRWRDLDDFIISMLHRGIHPTYLTQLKDKLEGENLGDYIEIYHQDWIEKVAKAIRKDIPSYFSDEEE